MTFDDVKLYIDGSWRDGSGTPIPVLNPATEERIFSVARATTADLDLAVAAAKKGFQTWRNVPALERSKVLRKAADLLRERAPAIAEVMTSEQGKPLAEAKLEILNSADIVDWFAEEGRRTYGRVIPARGGHIAQAMIKEPVGVVAAFTPWNFPVSQAARKIGAALGSGCAIILKGPEETPGSCAGLVQAFHDAGLPQGALGLVFGVPGEISEYLIPHPVVRKVSFTGSTAVGKRLAELAGRHMKRTTMELGGHAPAIVLDDADIETASKLLAAAKFRNAGQVCVSPTRFMVQERVYDDFLGLFVKQVESVKVGDGLAEGSTMGALANDRRLDAIQALIADAVKHGAKLRTGGERIGNKGYFHQPTVLTDVPLEARAMNEEPFGPLALVSRFKDIDDAIAEANRLPYGLAAYAYTRGAANSHKLAAEVETGMLSINHHGLGLAEQPFGGVKESGYGSEGGIEAMEGYLITKFVTQSHA